jgi:hypothetical protein
VLGVTTLQLNRDISMGGVTMNQLSLLDRLGVFTEPLPAPPEKLPRLADYDDTKESLDRRARSYLHANCAHCHTHYGAGNSWFQLQANLPTHETRIIDGEPVHGEFGFHDARIVAPGAPQRSVLLHRVATIGDQRMPPIASSVVDEKGAELLTEWIREMPPAESMLARHKMVIVPAVGVVLGGAAILLLRRRKQSSSDSN